MTKQKFTGGNAALALGVCYYPEHWPEDDWADDAAQMVALGLRFVRIGEFAWSRLEPREGVFDFDWLDRAIHTLAGAGLQVILCTPTATPPKWLIDAHPDILPVDPHHGHTRGFGSRRHYDFSSPQFLKEAQRISAVLARRYGDDSRIAGWQTDNELCCHDTTHSASPQARSAFQGWCKNHYGEIERLNAAWGNVFWSMEYPSFDSIELPFATVTEPNPAHQLAYRRFASEQVIHFHDSCIDAMRPHVQGQWITHNFIPMKDTQVDCFALARPLDFVSYDSYPLGRSEFLLGREEPELAQRYMRTGHPDYTAYYLDQCRGLKRQGFWIMEQQPGPVNWAPSNPRPAEGMVTLWTLEAIAHGADVVSYFRWRQAAFAQEQMHAGLLRPDRSRSDAWAEIETVVKVLDALAPLPLPQPTAQVALVVDVSAQWVTEIEKQGQHAEAQRVAFQFYRCLRQLDITVDIVSADADLAGYALVMVPSLPIVRPALLESLADTSAAVLFGPRCGAKTEEFQIPPQRAPGALQTLVDIRVNSVETLRPDVAEGFDYQGNTFLSRLWCEDISVGNASVEMRYQSTRAGLVRNNRCLYLATLTDDAFLLQLFKNLLGEAGISWQAMPDDVRCIRRGEVGFAFNYGARPAPLTGLADKTFLWGSEEIPGHGVSIWREPGTGS
ncbi:MAG: beta-galactosidase [Luminiphilus sp.]|nr:beta-galactosidase [Luminiphilus sp.]